MKKLYKSRTDKIISGVCGGIAKYFDIDPMIVRIVWVAFSFMGAGIIAYIVCMFIMPDEPQDSIATSQELTDKKQNMANSLPIIFGAVLLVFGLSLLFGNLGLGWIGGWIGKLFWPLLLVCIGAVVIYTVTKKH